MYESPKLCYILFLTYHFFTTDFCIVLRCMVHGYAFYIAVVVPVSTILLANTVALIIVMYNLYQRSQDKARKLSDGDKNKKPMTDTAMIISQTRIAFACNVLLGITWIFALLAVGKATIFFQWLFCIFNSLQGFFIFVFYTVRNQDVKKAWVKCGRRRKQKSSSTCELQQISLRGKWCTPAISNFVRDS